MSDDDTKNRIADRIARDIERELLAGITCTAADLAATPPVDIMASLPPVNPFAGVDKLEHAKGCRDDAMRLAGAIEGPETREVFFHGCSVMENPFVPPGFVLLMRGRDVAGFYNTETGEINIAPRDNSKRHNTR